MDEKGDACRIAEELARRGYGLKRIVASLRTKGYSDEALDSVIDSLEDVDFVENCTRVARVKFKKLKNDRAEVQKALAKLVNLGYNVSDAKVALETVLSEQNQ
jgi:SOS response regulatory protein OraA/RecX